MLRLLIVAEDAREERDMVGRAEAALADLSRVPDAEIVVSPRSDGRLAVARLDAGLFTRPLPDRVVVVGRDRSCSPAELAFLNTMLDLRPELSAVTAAPCPGLELAPLLEHGGIFGGGQLCQAGGFAGDGRRSVRERLTAVGFASAILPEPPSLRVDVRDPQRWSVPA